MDNSNSLGDTRKRGNAGKKIDYLKPLLGIAFLTLVFNFYMASASGDDITYLDRLNSMGLIEASKAHYQSWSSRIIIEAALMYLAKYFTLWKILNAAVMTGTIWILTKYAFSKITGQTLFLTFALYSFVPYGMMNEAGWVATALNYHWAVFLALIAFYPFYQKLHQEKISILTFIISVAAVIFVSNQEQVNLCFLVFTTIISVYLVKQKQYELKLLVFSLLSCAGLALFLLSPGNSVRTGIETDVRFPAFADFSFINKLDIGLSSFGKPFFIDSNILFFLLFALVAFLAFTRTQNYYLRFLSMVPLGFNVMVYLGGTMRLGFTHYASNHLSAIFSTDKLNEIFADTGTGIALRHPSTWLPTLLILGLIFCLLVGLAMSFEDPKVGILAALMLLMGASARILMGFSPTSWASGIRTYFVTYMVAVFLVLLLLNELRKISKSKSEVVGFAVTVVGFCTFLLAFFNR